MFSDLCPISYRPITQAKIGASRERYLGLICELNYETTNGKRRLIGKAVIDALVAHVPGEHAAVGGEASNGDAYVVVDLENLLLVGRELGAGLVDACQDDVGLGSEADRGRALLHRLHRVLHLKEPPGRAPGSHIGVVLVPEHGGDDAVSSRSEFEFRCPEWSANGGEIRVLFCLLLLLQARVREEDK